MAPPNLKYLVGTGATPCATIEAANAAYAELCGCDGVQTKYWFPILVLTTGVCAIQVIPGDPYYDVTVSLPVTEKNPQGLTVSLNGTQIGALVTRASLAGTLPGTLTLAQFEAILTTPQLNALNNANLKNAHPVVYNDWQEVQTAGYVDTLDPTFQDLATQALAAGLITQAQYNTFTTPTLTAPGP